MASTTFFSNITANWWRPGFVCYPTLQLWRATLVPVDASGSFDMRVITSPCLLAWLLIKALSRSMQGHIGYRCQKKRKSPYGSPPLHAELPMTLSQAF